MPGSSVPSNTGQTYAYTTIREDLSNIVYELTPTETPIFQAVGRKGEFENTYHEWSTVVLAAANPNNAEVEGTDVTADAAYAATRLGNYAQLMDKVASISDTQQRVKSAGDITKMAKQVLYHTQALKRDMESRLLASSPAVPGNASTARQTAGIFAFLHTNVSRGTGGANGTLSGGTTGYPNAGPTVGTARVFNESLLASVLQSVWQNGGNANMICVGGFNKRQASTFAGNASRFKKAEDKKLIAAIEVYESDFGQLQVVPSRNTDPAQALVLDTDMVDVGWLQPMRNEALAKTGHSDKRMIFCEWGVVIGNERAHGTIADLTTS
jgi:hypothetical protein